jgi:hypothetical protein
VIRWCISASAEKTGLPPGPLCAGAAWRDVSDILGEVFAAKLLHLRAIPDLHDRALHRDIAQRVFGTVVTIAAGHRSIEIDVAVVPQQGTVIPSLKRRKFILGRS